MDMIKPHSCDLCRTPSSKLPVIYDAQVTYEQTDGTWIRRWAWACEECFQIGNGKLGTGRGQKFSNTTLEKLEE